MNFIDVTLRDGGHQNNFNWPSSFVRQYLEYLQNFPEISYVELGYWKQTGKFDGPFYNLNENLLQEINSYSEKALSIMVDYHYCSHDLLDFPRVQNFDKLGLIRVCLRKEDVREGCEFISKLKKFTSAKVSINFFNITNYSVSDLEFACAEAGKSGADFMYFADTHGALDLGEKLDIFKSFTSKIKEIGLIPGLHLHDHSGKAYFNYRMLNAAGFDATDVSLGGLGKGLGNLRLEHVFDLDGREGVLDFLLTEKDLFSMPSGPYAILTARDSITDHYAVAAEEKFELPSHFAKKLERINGKAKDNYNPKLME